MALPDNVLIAGYFGFANAGDEMILDAMVQDFRSKQPEILITVVSGSPEITKKRFQVDAVPWADIRQIVRAVEACDLVILGGGGLFHDYWGFDAGAILTSNHIGFSFYSSIAMLAAVLKKPLMLYAVGVGPILSKEGFLFMKAIARQATIITVRDEESRDILLSMGIESKRILVTADPVFNRSRANPGGKPRSGKIAENLLVGVALRNWDVGVDPAEWEKHTARGLDKFLERHPGGQILFVPFQDSNETLLDDPGIARRVQRLMKNQHQTSIYKSLASLYNLETALSGCDLILGMRLHSLILAIKYGIPAVALSYDQKIANAMIRAGLESYSIPISELDSERVSGLLERALRSRKSLHVQMLKAADQFASDAEKNVQSAMNLLAAKSSALKIDRDMGDMFTRAALNLVDKFDVETVRTKTLVDSASSLESSLAEKQAIENEQKKIIFQLNDNIERLNRKILDTQAGNQARENEFMTRIESLNQEDERLKNELEEMIMNSSKLEEEILSSREKYHKLSKRNRDLSREIETRKKESDQILHEFNSKNQEKERTISALTSELAGIKNSRGWKILWRLWQIRLAIIPHGSKREEVARSMAYGLRKVRAKPIKSTAKRISNQFRLLMSRYAYPFRVYKKRRDSTWNASLSQLDIAHEPGLVSVILPVHNGIKYLRESVKSVLNQTYKNFELIILDDGSTDESGTVIDEFAAADKRIKAVHQENQKLPQTLNNGFNLARGEYLTWTSDDNRMKPQFLQRMVSNLNKHPSWDMTFANMDIIGEDGKPLLGSEWYAGYQLPYGSEHVHLPVDTSELNTWPNNFIGGAFLYRRRVDALLAGYSQNQFTREDYDYWMQVNSLFTLKHANFRDSVYDYRFHSASLTQKDEELNITRNRKFLMAFDDFRRDFYLMPLIWVLDDDPLSVGDKELRKKICHQLKERKQELLNRRDIERMNLPHLFIPQIYLAISNNPAAHCGLSAKEKEGMIKVLLCTSSQPLPAASQDWDISLSLRSTDNPVEAKGWWSSSEIMTLLKAVDIKVRSMHLHKIENETRPVVNENLKISVILCTYQRNQVLEKTLHAIANQTMPQSEYEVVVVDNAPKSSSLLPLIEQIRKENFCDFPDHLRVVHCPILGLSFARNAGIAEAKSEILLFLDDDAVARPDVLEQHWKAFSEHADAGVIGGHIILQKPEKLQMVWKEGWERYWSQFKTGYKEYTVADQWWEFPWGANWCARRTALLQIGGFRGKYGRRGSDYSGGEEIIAASLIQRLGYSIGILPQAEVIHQVDPARFTLMHLKKTINAGIQVNYQAQQDLYLPYESSFQTSLRQSRETIGKFTQLIRHPKNPENQANRLEISYYIQARIKLMSRQLTDNFRRIRFLFPLSK